MKRLIAFDIDNVLEVSAEPGPVTLGMVRRARELGFIIGSCSDIPVSQQQAMWERHSIPVDFTVLKHRLDELKPQFQADECYLVSPRDTGDYSRIYGFVFLPVFDIGNQPWMVDENGGTL
ncbi:MAG: hypothetical protein OYI31_05215 [Chloroflexota bacterium]|nr:hypothetical protein [Chloroflexota bacterium]MDE2942481.1 hypothetical protein [Chloroflexota bacterium]MDE3267839.1 hypothetical protein [Chloroflexota bacterium]